MGHRQAGGVEGAEWEVTRPEERRGSCLGSIGNPDLTAEGSKCPGWGVILRRSQS